MVRAKQTTLVFFSFVILCIVSQNLYAAQASLAPDRISDVVNTKHNFATAINGPILPTGSTRTVEATSEQEVCVFCHIPHFAPDGVVAPLWNRAISIASYTNYTSSSLDAITTDPGISSKLCLSCHDGTLAMGALNMSGGQAYNISISHATLAGTPDQFGSANNEAVTIATANTISMVGGVTTMPVGSGVNTGFTSNIGTDLTNDHPIGITYNTDLANLNFVLDADLYGDGELVDPGSVDYIKSRQGRSAVGTGATDTHMYAPLEAGKVECVTCHDPHIRGSGADVDVNIKFLRLNRFQKAQPIEGAAFSAANDVGCIACHQKTGWADSIHANFTHASAAYNDTAANIREFPLNTTVAESSCLACHDAHTVQGAKTLLREGTDTLLGSIHNGGNSAQEETCFQCHGTANNLQSAAKDIESVILLTGGHSGISITAEAHNINKTAQIVSATKVAPSDSHDDRIATSGNHIELEIDFTGVNRHIECADCHHSHRMTKNTTIANNPAIADSKATHEHDTGIHSNIISGSLRGTWGVEPHSWASDNFDLADDAIRYDVKQGNPVGAATTDVTDRHVTREYQICMRCHSNFAYTAGAGLSNPAQEFRPIDNAAANNHRSWHPVVGQTNRNNTYSANFEAAFATGVGSQTMYCSDCHASSNIFDPKGAHGSGATGKLLIANKGEAFCTSCHKASDYTSAGVSTFTGGGSFNASGFACSGTCVTDGSLSGALQSQYSTNLHVFHDANPSQPNGDISCDNCHVALAHGWQNKALLVNLTDAGEVANAGASPYTNLPYYENSTLFINAMQTPATWTKVSCGTNAGCH